MGNDLTVVKGAPERLLARAGDGESVQRAAAWCREQASAGRRVLVVAEAPSGPTPTGYRTSASSAPSR